jgi:aldehyde dehydrogenase (NAD+)
LVSDLEPLPRFGLYWGGSWHAPSTGRHFPTYNPYTQTPWAEVAEAGADDVTTAVDTACEAFDAAWRGVTGAVRSRLLYRLADLIETNADDFARNETRDNGKVIRETKSQILFLARTFRFFAGYADKLWGKVMPLDRPDVFDFSTLEPLGVVGIITAWNSPMALLGNKLPAALAAGNCVVIKPSEHASVTTLKFVKLVEEAGFPPGVVNVVTGDGAVGQALVSDRRLAKISFTGSGAVGRKIAARAGEMLTPVILELGGKSPNIVFGDADIRNATAGALAGIFGATGQTCIAGSRLLVQRGIYDAVVAELARRAGMIRLGDPSDPATEMGTVANQPQFDRILDFIAKAKSDGARLVAGGERATGPGLDQGLFIKPTIFADVRNDMMLARHEVFGPVLSIIPFDTEEEAVVIGNDTDFGLASGVWTRDINRAHRVSRALKAGLVWVNTYRAVAAQTPFGGVKDSGFGRERGEEGLREFVAPKNVMINFSEADRDPFAVQT